MLVIDKIFPVTAAHFRELWPPLLPSKVHGGVPRERDVCLFGSLSFCNVGGL